MQMTIPETTWRRWLHRPQTYWVRRVLLQIHLWTGVALGLYVLLIAISGVILVFNQELQKWAYPAFFDAPEEKHSERVSFTALITEMKRGYPQANFSIIFTPTEEVSNFEIFAGGYGNEGLRIFSNPTTGVAIGAIDRNSSVFRWLEKFHFDLLIPGNGRAINGIGGAFVSLLCLSGIVIWWPGIKGWRRALKVDFRRSWKRVNWDLHSATGFWSVLFLLMWSVTAIYFGFPRETKNFISLFSPVSTVPYPVSDVGQQSRPVLSLDEVATIARKHMPESDIISLQPAHSPKSPYIVGMGKLPFTNRHLAARKATYVYIDRYTGAVLDVFSRHHKESSGEFLISWIQPLHFGDFGGLGLKIIWAIMGMTPAILAVSGTLMYWNRFLSKRWRSLLQLRSS